MALARSFLSRAPFRQCRSDVAISALFSVAILVSSQQGWGGSAQPGECSAAGISGDPLRCEDQQRADLTAKISNAYQAALDRVGSDQELASSLESQQTEFQATLDSALQMANAGGLLLMRSWLDWLNAVAGRREGLEGAWISSFGSIQITERPDGIFSVSARADEPVYGSYSCEFPGVGRLTPEGLEVAWDPSDGDDGADGWTLTLRKAGALIDLEESKNDSPAEEPPFCGEHGSLAGSYLPARTLPSPVRAWQPSQ